MSDKTGGMAFPRPFAALSGMTLLDYLAGQALAGILSNQQLISHYADEASKSDIEPLIAHLSYRYAAALLTERQKRMS